MKKNLFPLFVLIFTLTIILVACGEDNGEDSVADTNTGEQLFAQSVIGSQAGCVTCHSLQEGVVIVGPSMAGIGNRAGSVVEGQSAQEYLRASILDPDAHVVDGFPPGVMPKGLSDELTDEQIDRLVAYLLTLK